MKPVAVTLGLVLAFGLPAAQAADEVQQQIFEKYLKLAEEGDITAQFVIAQRYESGRGTAQDLQKAKHWYTMAAERGHALAKMRLDEQRAAEPKPAVATAAAPVAAATAPAPAPKPVAAKPKPPAPAPAQVARPAVETTVAKAVAPEPARQINVKQAILGGKWRRGAHAAEFLPSGSTACLPSSDTEIVCFSQELTRNVDSRGYVYTVKATLSGFEPRDGRFQVRYVYNVVHVDSKPLGGVNVASTEVADIEARTGWQEPGQTLECRMNEERSAVCTRADRRASYQLARD